MLNIYRRLMKKMIVKVRQIMDMVRPMYDTNDSALEWTCSDNNKLQQEKIFMEIQYSP